MFGKVILMISLTISISSEQRRLVKRAYRKDDFSIVIPEQISFEVVKFFVVEVSVVGHDMSRMRQTTQRCDST